MWTWGPRKNGSTCPPLAVDTGLLRLRLDLEGTNGATTTTDTAASPTTVTMQAGTQISTAQAHCGNSSALFTTSGTSPRGILVADATKFNFGTGAFFMSTFFRLNSAAPSPTTARNVVQMWIDGGEARLGFRVNGVYGQGGDGTIRWYHCSDWGGDVVDSTTVVTPDEWHHVLIQRNSGSGILEFWLDGQLDETATLLTSGGPASGAIINMSTTGLYVGKFDGVGEMWDGYIDQTLIGAQYFDMTCYTASCLV